MKLHTKLAALLFALLLAVSPVLGQQQRRSTYRFAGGYYTDAVGHRVRSPAASKSALAGGGISFGQTPPGSANR